MKKKLEVSPLTDRFVFVNEPYDPFSVGPNGFAFVNVVVGIIGVLTILTGRFVFPLLVALVSLLLDIFAVQYGNRSDMCGVMCRIVSVCRWISFFGGVGLLIMDVIFHVFGFSIAGWVVDFIMSMLDAPGLA